MFWAVLRHCQAFSWALSSSAWFVNVLRGSLKFLSALRHFDAFLLVLTNFERSYKVVRHSVTFLACSQGIYGILMGSQWFSNAPESSEAILIIS